ncbi:MAG: DNA primase [Candidatus Moranbacteria bacterium CG_4_9_14_3_um_filter_36_9]|nr:MAG: DNA primase [Candidatus Moranbacteria bacterium CG_4_9_14_3_um_filter_36_9]
MNSDVEEIKSRLDITDVLGTYIRLDKAGANYRALCPFHNEKSPSFMVSAEKQIWHCFGCGKGGDIFGFVMEMEGLDFRETLKILGDKAGVKLKNFNPEKEKYKDRTLEILELATKFYEKQLWDGAGKLKIMEYLRNRGIKETSIKKFRLGYAPTGWRNLLTFLTGRGYKAEEIFRTGLVVKKENKTDYYDRFRNRIIFPVADTSGRVVGFSARVAPGEDESQAKYVNTPETDVYHKSKILYGIDQAKGEIKKKDFVLLVEGNLDVVSASQAGLENVVAVSGTALTPDQLTIIKRYTNNIKMLFDMDSAGEAATKKSLKLCFAKEINVQVVELSGGKDAADMVKENPQKLLEAVETSKEAMEYFFDKVFSHYDKRNVKDKKNIGNELLGMIIYLENSIEKSHWLKKLAEELDVKETALTDALKKANLRTEVNSQEKFSEEKKFETNFLSKKEVLANSLAGLMFSYPEVWKKISQEEKRNIFSEDSLLEIIVRKGPELNFSLEKLLQNFENKEDLARINRIFFESRYKAGADGVEEIKVENPQGEADLCLEGIIKEQKKEKLEKISQDLKMAEKNQDQEAIVFLREQFNEIAKEK